ncbi:cytochrome C biogenesis protein [Rhizobium sp. Root708]|uniref:cytochrome c biogenesis protein DipZ n=1 Tax=Rhizobium sp. Root708 TaxID=1736592 RepID=UPI0006F971E4|nr:cytochrome c biogenesis protein DipZ [Rhizobium sp. Root708]KRB61968.1 cytochrome C biogenesis protein [Rhizobium sp. Root708]
MTLLIIAYLGGALTILSPCILPILPFVFARAGQPFLKSTLPMLVGMAATFAVVATLAAVGGAWAIQANEYGRIAAIVLLAFFGLSLLSPRFATRITQPVVGLGNDLLAATGDRGAASSIRSSLLLGVATGLLWAPCAGPILGLVLTGAALHGANLTTSLLLLAYAAGAATSLAAALLLGGRIFAAMKRSLGIGERIRQVLGVAVLAGVAIIASGLDTTLLARLSYASTASFEQAVLNRLDARSLSTAPTEVASNATAMLVDNKQPYHSSLGVEGRAPSLDGAVEWLNSPPLTEKQLRGKVVLVDFWTYSCINCIRTLPYVREWAEKYKDQGLVVIGVHTPEFAFEKKIDNVKKAVADFKIDYPVAIDNDYRIWRAFENNYWPAHYLIDADGQIRYHHFGEGDYRETEQAIQDLLHEAGSKTAENTPIVAPDAKGAEMAPDLAAIRSGETYIGYQQASNFVSPEGLHSDAPHLYSISNPHLNEWGLSGTWTVGAEAATLDQSDGGIAYRFSARDLHLVLGPDKAGKPIRFKVTVDGKPPGADHGADVDADGNGTVTATRLYQLVRQSGTVTARNFEIKFLDPGVNAYAFTFG